MANATIYNAVLKDIIPEGLVLIEDDWEDWTYNAGSWTHNGAIGPYGSSDLYLRFNTTQSGNFTNVVNGTNGVTNNTTNTTFEVLKPDLSVTKVVNTTFTVIGRNVEFTITVINTGDCDLGDVFVVEEYPDAVTRERFAGVSVNKIVDNAHGLISLAYGDRLGKCLPDALARQCRIYCRHGGIDQRVHIHIACWSILGSQAECLHCQHHCRN